jgi:hypothetical protein
LHLTHTYKVSLLAALNSAPHNFSITHTDLSEAEITLTLETENRGCQFARTIFNRFTTSIYTPEVWDIYNNTFAKSEEDWVLEDVASWGWYAALGILVNTDTTIGDKAVLSKTYALPCCRSRRLRQRLRQGAVSIGRGMFDLR